MKESISLKLAKKFLGKKITIKIDQPYGTFYKGAKYKLNYGYVPNTKAPDGEGLDAYYLDSKRPQKTATGKCIAIIHRLSDDDDKLIITSSKNKITKDEIEKAVNFREKYFKHIVIIKK